MKIKNILIALAVMIPLTSKAQIEISPSKYDYSGVASQITAGATSKYEQAKMIYKWICMNIAYDTTYSIFTSDICWEQKRGTSQAYSELFYRLGEPLGLETQIVTGMSKDVLGNINTGDHAWLIVTTENGKIFIDPTWGAGTVNQSIFHRKANDMTWFDVDPYVMACSHFSYNPEFQMIDPVITMEEFTKLGYIAPSYIHMGLDRSQVFEKALNAEFDLPDDTGEFASDMGITSIPMTAKMRIGQEYTFKIEYCRDYKYEISGAAGTTKIDSSNEEGEIVVCNIVPKKEGEIHLIVRSRYSDLAFSITYQTAEPTAEDWKVIETKYPYEMPELTDLQGYDAETIKLIGINPQDLLQAVRNGHITGTMPEFYQDINLLRVVDIPLVSTLTVGTEYTFVIQKENKNWAIYNSGDWYTTWEDIGNGNIKMTVTPAKAGLLSISVEKNAGSRSFNRTICYKVTE